MGWVEHDHANGTALAEALAEQLHACCRDAIERRGRARLALAGGSTPLPAYRLLGARDLDWSRVWIVPTDERCVPHAHPASNVKALRAAFAQASGEHIEALTTPDGDPARSESCARKLFEREPEDFDAVVLGMGLDAHTASLFPGAPQIDEALDPDKALDACRIDPLPLPPEAPFPRITLTLPRLLRTRTLMLALSGEEKRAVLRLAQAGDASHRRPISAFLHATGATVHVHWSP